MVSMARKTMELLAPAGDEAALRAAVCAGADAVYLGYSMFGARASATNFDDEALEKAVAYAHTYHVRVHVTVNTLIKQGELEAVDQALSVINCCGADVLLVQDLGVAALAKARYPALKRHASTQLSICDAYGARFAKEQGFSRVVLARECTLDDMRRASEEDIETEAFVHGALCSSMSGQCLMSSLSGGRSGNRGRCAQPCRQEMTLGGRRGALLSLKDLMLRDALPQLMEAGVCSLKIEGRLKRPEYVAVVTESYRRALDELARGEFFGTSDAEKKRLMQAYHRGGFTGGHALGAEDAALVSEERVGHGGVAMGRVTKVRGPLADIRLTETLHDGDGLQLRGREDYDLRYAGPEKAQGQEATVRLRPGAPVQAGDSAVRLTDAKQDAWAHALTEKPIPVSMQAVLRVDEPMRLTISDGESSAEVLGDVAQHPISRALTEEELRRQLGKLGDTPLTLQRLDVEMQSVFAPVSALNALRRNAVDAMLATRRAAFRAPSDAPPQPLCLDKPLPTRSPLTRELAVLTHDAALGEVLLDAGATLLMYEPEELSTVRSDLERLPQGAWLALPPQLSAQDIDALLLCTGEYRHKLGGVVVGTAGQLGAPWPVPVALGTGVQVSNREAARALLAYQPRFFCHWPEWNEGELKALALEEQPALLTVYGRERLMVLNHCPARAALSLRNGHAACRLCDEGREGALKGQYLRDRKGYEFPLWRTRTGRGCVISVLAALPTELSRFDAARRALGAGMLLRFSVEDAQEQLRITRAFAALQRGERPDAPIVTPATAGHFTRGAQ